jgi:hypothetical protein
MATYHPAALLRDGNLRSSVERDIAYFVTMVREEMVPVKPSFCCRCGKLADTVMDDFPYCGKHYPREPRAKDVQLPLDVR